MNLTLLEILQETGDGGSAQMSILDSLGGTFSFCKEANPRGSDNDLKSAKILLEINVQRLLSEMKFL